MDDPSDGWNALPATLRGPIEARLNSGETVSAWLETDLDLALHYARGLVVLTKTRLLAVQESSTGDPEPAFQAWPLNPAYTLHFQDHAGVGTLEWMGPEARLGYWRFTVNQSPAARRFVQSLGNLHSDEALTTASEEREAIVCPSCGGPLKSEDAICPTCSPASGKPPAMALLRLGRFAKPRAGMIALGFVLTLTSTAIGLIPPYLTMPLLDKVLIPHQNGLPVDRSLVVYLLAGLAGASFLAWMLNWARSHVLAWVSERVSADLRNATYSHLQRLSLEFFGGKRTGDLIARVGTDTDRICNFLALNLLDFATDTLMIIMTAVILFTIDPLLALVTLIPFPAIAVMVHWVRTHLRRGFRTGGRAWGEMTNILADTIPGVRVVKAFAQETREVDRFRQANDHVVHANDRVNRLWAFFGPTVALMTDGGWLLVWAFGAWRVLEGQITVGVLTAFVAYIIRFYSKLEAMTHIVAAVQRAGASAQRIFEILDRVPRVPEPVRAVHPGRVRGEIEFRNVGFRYGSRQVLSDLDLSIAPGEMIGLVGPSGSGKSTLINLVCRFYDVCEGSIRVDGQDIRSFPIEEYRRNIGIVLQEPFLFYGSIAENIAYGRPEAKREEIIAAAQAARAHEFILKLPEGYDSLVGERGQTLSGGERQRISIARALLIDPRILILDEATSSVDTETERQIQEALENLIQGRTTIAIAHRLSTLRRADRLVVLERGRMAEVGPHSDLLKSHGMYARLHQAQVEMAAAHAL